MRIGQLAEVTGTTPKTLRFYESRGLLPRARRASNGYREYDEEAVARLDFIRRARAAGLTLAQIREVVEIRDHGRPPCHHVEELLATRLQELDHHIAELRRLRDGVAALHAAAQAADPDTCSAQQVCRYV